MGKQKTGRRPMEIVRELCALPHRGATTQEEKQAAAILQRHLEELGAEVELQRFKSPRTYISVTWWALGVIVISLVLVEWITWVALVMALPFILAILRFFDWRSSPLIHLPPVWPSLNVIGRWPAAGAKAGQGPRQKLILMAHYDSAPVSKLYHENFFPTFHKSLLVSIFLIAAAVFLLLAGALRWGGIITLILRGVFILYFLMQGILVSVDYLKYGFNNGADDNASGVGTALVSASRLLASLPPGWDLEVVFTSAEETCLLGSYYYFKKYRREFQKEHTYLINIDGTGSGKLKIITATGSVSRVSYNNVVVETARKVKDSGYLKEKAEVVSGEWHTGDYDSIWFARAGIPSMTIATEKPSGSVSHIHRPDDTIRLLDEKVLDASVDFVEKIARDLMTIKSGD